MLLGTHSTQLQSRPRDIEEAINAGFRNYAYIRNEITSLKKQIEDLETRNSQLGLIVSKLKYLVISYPEDSDITRILTQILQEADQLRITDQLQAVHVTIEERPETVINGDPSPLKPRVKLPITSSGLSPGEDANVRSESLAENLERTNQLMRQAEMNSATMAEYEAWYEQVKRVPDPIIRAPVTKELPHLRVPPIEIKDPISDGRTATPTPEDPSPAESMQALTSATPATMEKHVLPHLRVPPHLLILQTSTSTHNRMLPAETARASSSEAKAEKSPEKENIKPGAAPTEITAISGTAAMADTNFGKEDVTSGADSVKTDPATRHWLDTLEVKGLLMPFATSTSPGDKLIDDFDDEDTLDGTVRRAPTPPGFTPISKHKVAVNAEKGYILPKGEDELAAAFMNRALTALPKLTEKNRSKSEQSSPDGVTEESFAESEHVAPGVNGTRVLGSLLDAATKKYVVMPNSRGDWYQPSMQWHPIVRGGKRFFVL